MHRRSIAFIVLLVAAASALAQFAPQKSSHGGVTVDVTPVELGAAGEWTFKVVLDTHSQDLSDDLTKVATLVDEAGRDSKPIAWEGAGPGGHHREGVLKFTAMQPLPATIELRIARAGEAAPRIFRWQLKQ